MGISIKSIYNWYRNTLRHPKYRWWIILGTIVYLLSPFDLSPDLLPIAGQIDDIAILTLLIAEVSQMLIDYFKTRQAETVSSQEQTSTETVNVDAVRLD